MKILFYVMALAAGVFGLLVLVRAVQSVLAGGGFDVVQFAIAIIGIFLATLWVKRAKAAK